MMRRNLFVLLMIGTMLTPFAAADDGGSPDSGTNVEDESEVDAQQPRRRTEMKHSPRNQTRRLAKRAIPQPVSISWWRSALAPPLVTATML
jgi:hypothetical protein